MDEHEPLLGEHRVREGAPPDALAGKVHGSDTGAAPSPTGAKNRVSFEKINYPKKCEGKEIIERHRIGKKTEDTLISQEIRKNTLSAKTDGPLTDEKNPSLTAENNPEKEPKNGDNNTHVCEAKILEKHASNSVQGAPLSVDAFAEAAETFARMQRGTELGPIAEDFAGKAREFANKPDDPVGRDRILQMTKVLSDAAALDTLRAIDGADIFHLLGAAYTVLSLHFSGCHPPAPTPAELSCPHEPAAVSSVETLTLESLAEQANAFAKSAAGTSMAYAADAFCRAAEHFVNGKDRKKRVIDTELNKAAMALFSVAEGAPSSEAGLAAVAIKLTHGAQIVLLSDTDSKPGVIAGWWQWRRASSTSDPDTRKRPSLKQRLWTAISSREPMLPIYAEKEQQLVDKREVLYALALAAPVAILTAAAGLDVFPGAWATVAGASVGVWILAASGMVLNQYAVFGLERLAARHLGRLGVLGAAVLFCFFVYRAFFPSTSWALWSLLAIAAIALGLPWIMSCFRGDDVISASMDSAGAVAGTAGRLEMPARRRTI